MFIFPGTCSCTPCLPDWPTVHVVSALLVRKQKIPFTGSWSGWRSEYSNGAVLTTGSTCIWICVKASSDYRWYMDIHEGQGWRILPSTWRYPFLVPLTQEWLKLNRYQKKTNQTFMHVECKWTEPNMATPDASCTCTVHVFFSKEKYCTCYEEAYVYMWSHLIHFPFLLIM